MSVYSDLRAKNGRLAGDAWGRDVADRSDLERLEEFADNIEATSGLSLEDWFRSAPLNFHGHAGVIAAAVIDFDDDGDDDELHEAAASIFGEDYGSRSTEWLAGFLEAAIQLLRRIEAGVA